jgi:hypothetical protein
MDKVQKMYESSLLFSWGLLNQNPNYYLELNSISTFQKLDELYDMLTYFLEKQEYEKCIVIQKNIEVIKKLYHVEINSRGSYENKIDGSRDGDGSSNEEMSDGTDAV